MERYRFGSGAINVPRETFYWNLNYKMNRCEFPYVPRETFC